MATSTGEERASRSQEPGSRSQPRQNSQAVLYLVEGGFRNPAAPPFDPSLGNRPEALAMNIAVGDETSLRG